MFDGIGVWKACIFHLSAVDVDYLPENKFSYKNNSHAQVVNSEGQGNIL